MDRIKKQLEKELGCLTNATGDVIKAIKDKKPIDDSFYVDTLEYIKKLKTRMQALVDSI